MITLGPLNDIDGVRHAFFTREGGVSEGLFASLNCGLGSGDVPDNVATNRARAMNHLDLSSDSLITCYQMHSANVVEVERPWRREDAPRADAMVTRNAGLVLGVLTADCAPVLLADRQARVIGAAHAGWRGALAGVIEATLAAMVRLGADPKRIVAGIGPCIGQRSYEVGPEFPAPFIDEDPANAALFVASPNSGRFMFDLREFVARRLRGLGLRHVLEVPADTCREEQRFFSYRRACLRGERDYGRGLSAIALEP
ncbi:MAG TPA: peptidoglycan editing factor PgeF [Alphaproteobacteria bacterium]|nr:peptidoglycan editing factor PgeF [Alphaproteobacteria bacterium]